jgi:hypothetical protein
MEERSDAVEIEAQRAEREPRVSIMRRDVRPFPLKCDTFGPVFLCELRYPFGKSATTQSVESRTSRP